MDFQHPLVRDPRVTLCLTTAAQLHDLPPLQPIPGLFSAHRLSLILGTSGSGMTQLACHLASFLAPAETSSSSTPTPPKQLPFSPAPSSGTPSADEELADGPANPLDNDLFRGDADPDPVCPTVLMISQRDSADVLKPRLTALDADLRRILILTQVAERSDDRAEPGREYIRPFTPSDHDTLSQLLRENKGIRMVLIDNADWMFSATNHPTRAQIQRQLACLETVASQREVAIVLLTAIPALTAHPFTNRLLQTLHDACRTVHLLAPDLQHPDARLLFTLKNTVSPTTATLRLHTLRPGHLTLSHLPTDLQAAGQLPPNLFPQPGGGINPIDLNPAALGQPPLHLPTNNDPLTAASGSLAHLTYPHYLALRNHPRTRGPAPHQHDFACEVLIETLRHGPLPPGRAAHPLPGTIRYHADQAGVSWGTICRAKKTLQITATQTSSGWVWTLPPTILTSAPAVLPSALANQNAPDSTAAPGQCPPPAAADQTPTSETCASDPHPSAQVLTPPSPAPLPTPTPTNLSICPLAPSEPQLPTPELSNPQVPPEVAHAQLP